MPERLASSSPRWKGSQVEEPWFHRKRFIIPLIVIIVIFGMSFMRMGASEHLEYSTVTGCFLQNDPVTNPNDIDLMKNFGLVERPYDSDEGFDAERLKTQWERFANYVARLNVDSDGKAKYKVLFLARHGEGYHNLAEAFYGTEAWDCYWSLLDGNETIIWADARLTATGAAQAQGLSATWSSLITTQGLPPPEKYYTSPLTRCIETSYLTFSPIQNIRRKPAVPPFHPIIKELLRETLGVHTCDRRSRKSEIAKVWGGRGYEFEAGFEEEDILWRQEERETDLGQDERSRLALDEIFTDPTSVWISITSHSGQISSLLRVLNHPAFQLSTGGMVPVLVKAQLVPGTPEPTPGNKWTRPQTCSAAPGPQSY